MVARGPCVEYSKVGQYFLVELDQESIVVVRASESRINGFYNVCRHRGSRICLEARGKRNLLTCPYHAWSYDLEGQLKSARLMPDSFDPSQFSLHQCHLQVFEGLIFLCLAQQPPDFETLYGPFKEFAVQQGIESAKVATQKVYKTKANGNWWSRNFVECYHCLIAHPEYTAVHSKAKILGQGAGFDSVLPEYVEEYKQAEAKWERNTKALGHLTGSSRGGDEATGYRFAHRVPIREGFKSETLDDNPLAPNLWARFATMMVVLPICLSIT